MQNEKMRKLINICVVFLTILFNIFVWNFLKAEKPEVIDFVVRMSAEQEYLVQVFWSEDGEFAEENSQCILYKGDMTRELTFEIPLSTKYLRIDFANQITEIQIDKMRLKSKGIDVNLLELDEGKVYWWNTVETQKEADILEVSCTGEDSFWAIDLTDYDFNEDIQDYQKKNIIIRLIACLVLDLLCAVVWWWHRKSEHMLKDMSDFAIYAIHGLWILLLAVIFVATIIFDKKVANPFPNTVKEVNALYYLGAFMLLGVICGIYRKLSIKVISEKAFVISIFVIATITLLIQTMVSLWVAIEMGADFGVCREMAMKLVEGGDFSGNYYFGIFPNNVNIVMLMSWVYGISGSWRFVIWLGAVFVNISVVMVTLTVYNCTENKFVSLVICVLGEILIALSWRTFIPYTDNYGMLFTVLILWAYTSKLKDEYKVPLVFVFGLMGTWIKITNLIVLLAIIIWVILNKLRNGESLATKKVLSYVVICCLIFAEGKLISTNWNNYYRYKPHDDARNWQYYFMMGQDGTGLGTVASKKYGSYTNDILSRSLTVEEEKNAYFEVAMGWVKDKGVAGNIKYFIDKINVVYNDGYFHPVAHYSEDWVEHNFWYEIYHAKGKYYAFGANIMQILWDFVLLSFMLGAFFRKGKDNTSDAVFKIIILGVTLYLMLFEARSKYLFMFVPVFVVYAGIILNDLLGRIEKVKTEK